MKSLQSSLIESAGQLRCLRVLPAAIGLLALSNGALAACTGASPTWASSVDYASLSSCVSKAVAGDTINVSSGTATYGNTLEVRKPIKLIGAGQTSTVITASGVVAIRVTVTSGDVRVSGFGFTGSGGSTPLDQSVLQFQGQPSGIFNSARLDHCQFTNIPTWSVYVGEWYNIPQHPKMLIDHITSNNNYNQAFMKLHGSNNTWKLADQYGTDFAIYIEDSTFSWNTANFNNYTTDTEHGGRIVVRNNKFVNSSIQVHDTGSTEAAKGNRIAEIYNNEFICNGGGCNDMTAMGIRGGGFIVHDNIISSNYGPGPAWPQVWRAIQAYDGGYLGGRCGGKVSACNTAEHYHCSGGDHRSCQYPGDNVCSGMGSCVVACASNADCPSGVQCLSNVDNVNGGSDASGYPCRNQTGWGQESIDGKSEQPSPVYWYNNKNQNGALTDLESVNNQPTYFKKDRDYCYHDPSTACGAKPGWTYTAYAYPHPLQGGSTPGGTANLGQTQLRVISVTGN